MMPPTRTPPLGEHQRIPLSAALAAYTAGSAWINHDAEGGVIEVGNRADLVVLDRDPFDTPAERIAEAKVMRTYVAGELVHQI